jgi:excinuclease ABC subunit B
MAYNKEHNLTPKSIHKSREAILAQAKVGDKQQYYVEPIQASIAADPIIPYMRSDELAKLIHATETKMYAAAEDLHFSEAARLKEELGELKKIAASKSYK